MVSSPIMKVSALTKRFTLHMLGGKVLNACENVSFALQQGEFLGIKGPSGAGKSTIIKCIYRTYLPTAGQIWYSDKTGSSIDLAAASELDIIRCRQADIGYVSQFLRVIPRVSAVEILTNELRHQGEESIAARSQAEDMLALMNIDKAMWSAYPSTFSGGEQQRVNLARALIKKPRLLLLDEPTASLDSITKQTVVKALLDLKSQGTAMIGIFHDIDIMEQLVDSVYEVQPCQVKVQTGQEVL